MGSGRTLAVFAENGMEAYGCDYSPQSVAITQEYFQKKRLTAELTVADIRTLPYSDDFFDAVYSLGVLCYMDISDARQAVSEIYRVLKTGGQALLYFAGVGDTRWNDLGEKTSPKHYCLREPEEGVETFLIEETDIPEIVVGFRSMEITEVRKKALSGDKQILYYLVRCLK